MSIPIISEVISLVNKGLDKVFADKNVRIQTETDLQKFKEQLKNELTTKVIEIGFEEKKLLFQDTESAREVYIQELKTKNTPKWARAIQILGRQFALYTTISLYVYSKICFQFGLPQIILNEKDYYLIELVFVFLFGARTIEKILRRD